MATASPARKNPTLWWIVPIWLVTTITALMVDATLAAEPFEVSDLSWMAVQGTVIATGVLILVNRPGHRVGRLLLTAGLSFAGAWVVGVTLTTLFEIPQVSAFSALFLAFATVWVPLVAAALVLFPTGRLPSPRWRYVSWILWVSVGLALAAPLVNGGWGGDTSDGDFSPWHDQVAPLGDILSQLFFISLMLSLLVAVAAIVTRFIRARGEERQQMKWLALTSAIGVGWFTFEVFAFGATASQNWRAVVGGLTIVLIVGSMGLAIIKYRLYDIDRIISRTVSYALVAGLLGLIFFGLVTLIGVLAPGESPLAVAASTLVVAALFNPVRKRVQEWVDRRFNRSRYDAQRVVDAFTEGLRDETELDGLSEGLSAVVEVTFEPSAVGVWVKET